MVQQRTIVTSPTVSGLVPQASTTTGEGQSKYRGTTTTAQLGRLLDSTASARQRLWQGTQWWPSRRPFGFG